MKFRARSLQFAVCSLQFTVRPLNQLLLVDISTKGHPFLDLIRFGLMNDIISARGCRLAAGSLSIKTGSGLASVPKSDRPSKGPPGRPYKSRGSTFACRRRSLVPDARPDQAGRATCADNWPAGRRLPVG